jgi:hypothetical protein
MIEESGYTIQIVGAVLVLLFGSRASSEVKDMDHLSAKVGIAGSFLEVVRRR